MKNIGNINQYQKYMTMHNPDPARLPVVYEEWEQKAREVMTDKAYYYVAGGAGGHYTMEANRESFQKWKMMQRMLRGVDERDLSVELFGHTYASPLLHGPIGVQSIIHPDGELGSARACRDLGVPFIASSASSVPMEQVAEEMGDAPRWFQLYWSKDPDVTASFLRRAENAGFSAIVATLDTPMMAWREYDLKNVYLPFLDGEGVGNYFSDPAFRAKLEKSPEDDPQAAILHWTQVFGNASLTWDDLAFVKHHTDLPVLLKGIIHPDDARLALEYGADGIIVSNHGGRQVDGAIGALDALPEIVDIVQGKIPVLMDSGIRRGADIMKAMALGAEAVLVGRPLMYGLAVAGEAGVREVMRNMAADLDLTLGLAGESSVRELNKEILQKT